MRALLGGKGANLAEMTTLGLPVPYGFTVTTEACTRYYQDKKTIADEIVKQIKDALVIVEEQSGKKFGDPSNPFLVSVRSGARASMPGMMDTILNLGLMTKPSSGLQNSPATNALRSTATAASSRCFRMSSWKWKKPNSITFLKM